MQRSVSHFPQGIAAAGLLALASCLPPTAETPIPTLPLGPHDTNNDTLILFLPGRGGDPTDFRELAFAETLRDHLGDFRAVAVDAHLGYYYERSLEERLLTDVIEPARASGVTTIWMVGFSLGGLGSLMMAKNNPAWIDGVVVFAPFLGETESFWREIEEAGGLDQWVPPENPPQDEFEEQLWKWLQHPPDDLPIFLGYGTEDYLLERILVLAAQLPQERVTTLPGGHRKVVWEELWKQMVADVAIEIEASRTNRVSQ